jgi:hypothetical protein
VSLRPPSLAQLFAGVLLPSSRQECEIRDQRHAHVVSEIARERVLPVAAPHS